MAAQSKLRQIVGACLSGSVFAGCVIGIAIGISVMHWRFADEITNYDKVRMAALSCHAAVEMLAITKTVPVLTRPYSLFKPAEQ